MRALALTDRLRGLCVGGLFAVISLTVVGCSKDKRLSFTSTPPATVVAGAPYSYAAVVTGQGNRTVVYNLTTAPTGMMVDSSTGAVSWSPTAAEVGRHTVSLRAVAGSRSGSQSWTVEVLAATLANSDGLLSAWADGDRVAFHVHWRDSLDVSGEVPKLAVTVAGFAEPLGLDAAYGFGWVDGADTPDLTSRAFPELNSWTNPQTRADYVAMVAAFAQRVQPRYLLLGAPDGSMPDLAPVEWSAWAAVLADARRAVREASPDTVVLPQP